MTATERTILLLEQIVKKRGACTWIDLNLRGQISCDNCPIKENYADCHSSEVDAEKLKVKLARAAEAIDEYKKIKWIEEL